ncbi:MAG: helix-turn-helix domain-containing protein [Clostridiales bacterium]|nr:helix-turn-helix domain-containing protein [Clostridiales bacterium]
MKTKFSVSLRLLLHDLNIKTENSGLSDDALSFVCPALYTPAGSMKPEELYVGMLSDILPSAASHPDITFLCIRDQYQDENESDLNRGNMVILLTNLKLYELFNRVLQIFRNLREWDEAMSISTASNQGFQDLLDMSESMIGNHIDIMDATFKLLAYTRNVPIPDDPITVNLIEHGYHTEETIEEMLRLKRFEQYGKENEIIVSDDHAMCNNYVTLKRVFHSGGAPVLYVVMHCNHRKADESLQDLFQMLLSHISVYLDRDFAFPASFAASQQYLRDLLDGNIKSVDEAISRASYATIPFQKEYQLYLIAFDDNFNVPLDNLASSIHRELPFSYAVTYYRRIVILHNCEQNPSDTESVSLALKRILSSYSCITGISNRFQNLWEARPALEQAGCAIEYGVHDRQAQKDHSTDTVSFYDFEQSFLTLLVTKSFNTSPDLFKNCFMLQAVNRLKEYDDKHHTFLFETLRVWLECNRKATAAGEYLHMHRNTVLYHIDRIEQILGVSLDDADVCIKLHLGIRVVESTMVEILCS